MSQRFSKLAADEAAQRLAKLDGVVRDYLGERKKRNPQEYIHSFILRVIFDERSGGRFAVRLWLVSDDVGAITWRSLWRREVKIHNEAHAIEDWLDHLSRERQVRGFPSLDSVLYTSTFMVYRRLEMPDELTRQEAKTLLRALRKSLVSTAFKACLDEEGRLEDGR